MSNHGVFPRPFLLEAETSPTTQYRLYPPVENRPRIPQRIPLLHSGTFHAPQNSEESTYELLERPPRPPRKEARPKARFEEKPVQKEKKENLTSAKQTVSLKERIRHFTWAWFALPMSTGGVAVVLELQPHTFPGLFETGLAFYCLAVFFFLSTCTVLLTRFMMFPSTIKRSISHHREGLFAPTFLLSTATLLTGTHNYIIRPSAESIRPDLLLTVEILFYVYFVCAFLLAISQYTFLFAAHTYSLSRMMPSWMLPVFPTMLTGTIAGVIGPDLDENSRVPLLIVGLAAQGLGFWIAIFMYGQVVGRLMQAGLPGRDRRPALFINGGPPSFTSLALIGMADAVPTSSSLSLHGHTIEPSVIQIVALILAIFLWLLSFWFICVALISVLLKPPRKFTMGWWAMVFPNSGFIIATINIGEEINSEIVKWTGSVLSAVLVCVWIFVLYHNVRAFLSKGIMWPGKDEDADE